MEEIDYIARPSSSQSRTESELSATESSIDTQDNQNKQRVRVIDDTNEIAQMDEVFEAVIIAQEADPGFLGFDDDFVTQEDKHKSKREKRQSKQVLQELKSVLVGKQKEWEVREARAVARQKNVDNEDVDSKITDEDRNTETEGYLSVPQSFMKTNILGKYSILFSNNKKPPISSIAGLSQETDSDAESIRSDTNTIKSPESESKQLEDSLNGYENPDYSVSSTARTLSDSSDSNMSDAEVDIIHDYNNSTYDEL